jgi:hypothetical protein
MYRKAGRIPWAILCQLICPVENCITMVEHRVAPEYLNWKEFPKAWFAVE